MSIRKNVDALNAMILEGEILPAFEKFYAEDVVMKDNDGEPRVGKETNREYEKAFVGGLTEFRGAELKSSAIDEENGIAHNLWFFDFTHEDWGSQTYNQVAVQKWVDGKIVEETFYHG